MFDTVLVFGPGAAPRRLWPFPAAVAAHAVLVAVLAVGPLLSVGDPPGGLSVTRAFLAAPPAPAPPPPPPKRRAAAGGEARRIRAVRAGRDVDPGRFLAPVAIPDAILDEPAGEPGPDGGVEGGVEGGIPGGALDGLFGPILGLDLQPVEPAVRAVGDIKPPRLIKEVAPDYPEIARQARLEGVVVLEARTDVYGRVESITVLRSIPLLDQAAVEAVRRWVYEPLVVNGRPRGVVFSVTVRFTLK